MLESIQNVLNVPEFRKRAVFTLIMFIIFRLGVHIPVPGVDAAAIEGLFNSGNLFGLLDLRRSFQVLRTGNEYYAVYQCVNYYAAFNGRRSHF